LPVVDERYLHSLAECKVLVMANSIGPKDLSNHLRVLQANKTYLNDLVLLKPGFDLPRTLGTLKSINYDSFVSSATENPNSEDLLRLAEAAVRAKDILN
jgi:hypothetical protein